MLRLQTRDPMTTRRLRPRSEREPRTEQVSQPLDQDDNLSLDSASSSDAGGENLPPPRVDDGAPKAAGKPAGVRALPPTRRRMTQRSDSPFAGGIDCAHATHAAAAAAAAAAALAAEARRREVGVTQGKVVVGTRTLQRGQQELCLRAVSDVAEHATLVSEEALFTFHINDNVQATVEAALTDAQRQAFYALNDSSASDGASCRKSSLGVCITNAFSIDDQTRAVMRVCSRANHSCSPNAAYRFRRRARAGDGGDGGDSGQDSSSDSSSSGGSRSSSSGSGSGSGVVLDLYATRRIAAGEEVVLAYVDHALPRAQRQQLLLRRYGFQCQCAVCSLSGAALAASDARRHALQQTDALVAVAVQHEAWADALALASAQLARLREEPALATPQKLLRAEYDAACACRQLHDVEAAERWLDVALAHAEVAHGSGSEEVRGMWDMRAQLRMHRLVT